MTGAALGILMLAAVGPRRGWTRIAADTAIARGARALRRQLWEFFSALEMKLRAVGVSIHSCSFHLGQSAGPIAHGFARLHPDKWHGLLVGAAIIAAVAYAFVRTRWRNRL